MLLPTKIPFLIEASHTGLCLWMQPLPTNINDALPNPCSNPVREGLHNQNVTYEKAEWDAQSHGPGS